MITPPIPDESQLPITSNAPPPSPTALAMAKQAQQQQQASNQPPMPVPIAAQLVSGMIKPPAGPPDAMGVQRPGSRVDVFERFISQFVTALGQGLQAAHGPGAFGKGFGAAVTAPYQQDLQRFQLGQQAQANQAEIQQRQAQTQLTQAQANPVNIPGIGTIPAGSIGGYFGMQGRIGAAQATGQAGIQREQIAAQTKLLTTAMTNPSLPLDPTLAQAAGHPEWAGQLMGKAQLAALTSEINAKTRLVGTTKVGEQIREDADGNLIKIPVTSTSRPNLPTATPSTGAAAAPSATGTPSAKDQLKAKVPKLGGGPQVVAQGKTPPMVTGITSEGREVAGTRSQLIAAGVPTNAITPLPANVQNQVVIARGLIQKNGLFDKVDQDLKAFKPEELNGLSNRWQEFLTGTFGADDRYVQLRTHLNGLASTALMQAHVGSRGGEHMMEHFEDLANAKTFTYSNLKTALDSERSYVQDKAMLPTAAGGSGVDVKAFLKKHGF